MTSIRPESLSEALELLAAGTFTPYAGGTDLMVERQQDKPFLFIADLTELKHIRAAEDGLHIGGAVTLADLEKNPLTPALLRNAIAEIGSPATRNMGTLAGNIANASPAGDTLPVLYIYDAKVILTSTCGQRALPVDTFITGRKLTDRQSDELITDIVLPGLKHNVIFYQKYGGRRAMSISKLAVAALADVTCDSRIETMRLAFASMGPVPVRCPALEALCREKTVIELAVIAQELASAYAEACSPISDQRSTAEYRCSTAYRTAVWFFKNLDGYVGTCQEGAHNPVF